MDYKKRPRRLQTLVKPAGLKIFLIFIFLA